LGFLFTIVALRASRRTPPYWGMGSLSKKSKKYEDSGQSLGRGERNSPVIPHRGKNMWDRGKGPLRHREQRKALHQE